MGLFNLLSTDSRNTIVKKGMDMLDDAFYTKQEKAEAYKDLVNKANEQYLAGLKDNNATRSITRRWLAIPTFYTWIGFVITWTACSIFAPDTAKILAQGMTQISAVVTVIAGFYFGGHFIKK